MFQSKKLLKNKRNADGEEYERMEYTPCGEVWIEKASTASNIDIPWRFTGKERDDETGLYYYGARYLDSRTGRWLNADSALGDYIPGAPVTGEARKRNGSLPGMGGVFNTVNLHLYHYAGNNPVKYVDPDGREPIKHTELSKGRMKAEFLDMFGGSIKIGIVLEVSANLGALFKLNAKLDLGSTETTQDKNGPNSTDAVGAGLTLDVLGFGEIGGEISKAASASNSDSFFDHVENAWQNGTTEGGLAASINVRGSGIMADKDNDLKLEMGAQAGVGFKVCMVKSYRA
jgi:RHS repeat-associated protein